MHAFELTQDGVIRETQSVCPQCFRDVRACVIKRDGAVFLKKTCADHGTFEVELSRHPEDYAMLRRSHAQYRFNELSPSEYYLCATMRCNAACPICFLKQCPDDGRGMTLDEVEKMARRKDVRRFTFSHGEATMSPDLFDMIRILRRHGKLVNLHTNGLKLADRVYVEKLKAAGLDQVSLQFDSIEAPVSAALRGEGVLTQQERAFENLKAVGVPTTLNITAAKGVNAAEVGALFHRMLKDPFIKDLSFITYCHYDPSDKEGLNRYMMPDDVIEALVLASAGKISREDVVHAQELFNAHACLTRTRKCVHYRHYAVMRTGNGYLTLGDLIDLKKAAQRLKLAGDRGKKLTAWRFWCVILLSLRWRVASILPALLSAIFGRGGLQASGRFLAITFATICDPYKYDAEVASCCGQGLFVDGTAHDSYGVYLMREMGRKRRSS
jgi:MoaA/NifB/PqqE/SkfB family radical SAM enzyme